MNGIRWTDTEKRKKCAEYRERLGVEAVSLVTKKGRS